MSDRHAIVSSPLRLSPARLFLAFFKAGMTGFGGVLPMIRRVVVDERRWQTPLEFSELIALCQFLPGANVANYAVIFGSRTCGILGSVAALAGLMVAPMAIVLLLVRMYDEADALRVVQHLVAGLSVGAAGLILATAVKMALPLRGSARGIFVAAAGFVALALLHLPFLPTLCVLLPVSVAFAAASTRE